MNQLLRPLILFTLSAFCVTPVQAGGLHYQVSTSSVFYTDNSGQLAGVRMNWVYDPEVSAIILDGQDRSEAGIHEVGEYMMSDLHELGYFARFTMNGHPLPIAQVTDYNIKITDDNSIQLGLQVPLQQSVEVAGKSISLTLADPDGSGSLVYANADRIALEGVLADRCSLPDLRAEAIDMGGHELTLQTVSFNCQ